MFVLFCFEATVTVYLFNSLSRKLLQYFYLPTRKQYGEYVIEFKSFHQNGNISDTVAWKYLVFSTKY
jgi:hypothetical protein